MAKPASGVARLVKGQGRAPLSKGANIRRRGLFRFGTFVSASGGLAAVAALGANRADGAPGDKTPGTSYVPTTEKGVAAGVATLDSNAKIPTVQLPDLSASFPAVVNVKKHGAVGNGVADDTWAITVAVSAVVTAANLGIRSNLYFPPGTYNISRVAIKGISGFSISGEGRLIGQDPNTTAGIIRLIDCSNFTISGLSVSHSNATARNSIGHGIYATGCTDFDVSVSVSDVSAAGIFIGGSRRFRITKSRVSATLADGIHITGGSADFEISRNFTFDTGDDAIAVVSYIADGIACHGGSISTNRVLRSGARGITIMGDDIVVSSANTVTDCRAAGIYIAREGSFNTYGSRRITVTGNVVTNANTYSNPSVNHGSIHISSDSAVYPVEDVTISGNTIRGGRRQSILALGYAAGSVREVWSIGNNLSHNLGAESILYQQVENGGILGNVCSFSRTTGIFVDKTSSTIMVNANQVVKPNQANVTNSYAIANQSLNGSTGINFPRGDSNLTPLLEAVNATNTAGQLQAKANFEAIQLAAAASGRALLITGGSAIAVFRSDGQLAWASGGNAGVDALDVTLNRSAPGTLSTGAANAFRTGRGPTSSRPSAAVVGTGAMYFDTSLNKPIWSDGYRWCDALGQSI